VLRFAALLMPRLRNPRETLSALLVAVGAAVAVLCILMAVGVFQATASVQDRSGARSLSPAPDGGSQLRATITATPILGRSFHRVDVAVTDPATAPPRGLTRWPKADEVFASPGYLELLRSDPGTSRLAPGRIVGVVAEPGLIAPDELLVYRGAPAFEQPHGGIPYRMGGSGGDRLDSSEGFRPGQALALVAFVVGILAFPLWAFVAVAASLSASQRSRRLASLRLIGVDATMLTRANAIGLAAVAGLGAASALALYPLLNRAVAGTQLLGAPWFPQDTALQFLPALALVLLVTAVVVVTGSRTVRSAVQSPYGIRRGSPDRAAGRWRFLPLLLGLASLGGQLLTGSAGQGQIDSLRTLPGNAGLMVLSVLLTGVGLVLATRPLIEAVARRQSVRGATLPLRLGASRALASSRVLAGSGTVVALLVYVLAVGVGQSRDARATASPPTPDVAVRMSWNEGGFPLTAADRTAALQATARLHRVVSFQAELAEAGVALVRSCAELEAVAGRPMNGCTPDVVMVSPELPPERATNLTQGVLPGRRLTPATLPQELQDVLQQPVLIVSDGAVSAPFAEILVRVPNRAEAETVLAVRGAVPYVVLDVVGRNPDSARNIDLVLGVVFLSFLAALLISLVTLTAGVIDRIVQRRPADMALLLAGVPDRTLREAARWEVLGALGPLLGAGLVAGLLGGFAWQIVGGYRISPEIGPNLTIAVLGAACVTFASVLAGACTPRRLDPAELRRE
jgi:hypothetical protein